MRIVIKQTNISLTPEELALIEEKFESLEKYFNNIQQVRIEIEQLPHHQKGDVFRAEANFHIPNNLLRIEKKSETWRKAMEKVKDHAKRVLSEEKKKLLDKHRRQ